MKFPFVRKKITKKEAANETHAITPIMVVSLPHFFENLSSSWVSVGKYNSSGALEVAMYTSNRRAADVRVAYSDSCLESIVCCSDL